MIEVTRAAQRYPGGDQGEGVESWRAFSFGAHYDASNLRFGSLTACNEERLDPGAGYTEHTHQEVEIVTRVVEGALEHRDSTGRTTVVRAGETQWLSAGTGVRHSERNADPDRPCRFVQMWLEPTVPGGEPAYGTAREAPLRLPRLPGAALYVRHAAAPLPSAPLRYLHVVRGQVRLGAERLGPGDAARLSGGPLLMAWTQGDTEYMLWTMDVLPPRPGPAQP